MFSNRALRVLAAFFYFILPLMFYTKATAGDKFEDGKLLTCFVYSLHSISLLNQLDHQLPQNRNEEDIKLIINAIGGEHKIQLAKYDAEIVLEAFSRKVSDNHIIRIDEKLLDNPLWKISTILYDEWAKDKSFKDKFLGTFAYTQTCIDRFFK